MKRPTFTEAERDAFRVMFAYLESEGLHYESNPSDDHIWLDILKAREAFERIEGEAK